jgi:hypothetical protein
MKKIITSLMLAFTLSSAYATTTAPTANKVPETKRVCIEEKDARTGKVREVCRTIKIHEKLEGTKVPEKK